MQTRQGHGNRGPAAIGVAQTVKLAEVTNNPPQPSDFESTLFGYG